MKLNILELLAIFIQGDGLNPIVEPLPVVKQTILAPDLT